MRRLDLAAVVIIAALASTGCVHELAGRHTHPGTAPSPGALWVPPHEAAPAAPPAAAATKIPADLIEQAQHWGLPDLVRLALENSPDTRATWAAARTAAAELGSRRGASYPGIYADGLLSAVRGSAAGGRFSFQTTNDSASLQLNYLLFDFGGRKAAVDEAWQALVAADWTHNDSIQRVVLQVQQAYHLYLSAKAAVAAEEAAVKEAQTSLDAAGDRHAAGVATIADVLQAKTRHSQARLALQSAQGQVQVVRGVLATAAGIPANTAFETEIPPEEIPLQEFTAEVERAIEEAQQNRPDLAAARAEVQMAEAHYRDIRSDGLPTLTTTLNTGEIWYNGNSNTQSTYNTALLLRVPIFNGLTQSYNEMKARSQMEEAKARLEGRQQVVIFQVWSSYFGIQTARRKVETSADLLDSARQSYEVATARYKAGVGSILDLLAAANALENARAQRVQARTDLFLSLAQFAHDTGTLYPPGGAETKGSP